MEEGRIPVELTRKKHPAHFSSSTRTASSQQSSTSATPFVIVANSNVDGLHSPRNNSRYQSMVQSKKYGGRYVVWPGILLLSCVAIGAIILIYIGAIHTDQTEALRSREQLQNIREDRLIQDGKGGNAADVDIDVSDDGEVGNPTSYPPRECILPTYVSRNSRIYATVGGKPVKELVIKGINWFGMETKHGIPYGLWDNDRNGTTVYEIATFLARNRFNSVRLPLAISHVLSNPSPDLSFINQASNRGIVVKDYIGLMKSIVQALGHRNISVLLDFHTITPTDKGKLWYSNEVPEAKVLQAIDILTSELCTDRYWNIIGLDLKNEPSGATWGTGNSTDFKGAIERLGNRMLAGCPEWLAFAEGVNDEQEVTIRNQTFSYYDWWGGGLQKAGKDPPVLSKPEKIVWSPHYYSPAVYPTDYLYNGGIRKDGMALLEYNEVKDDAELADRVATTMDHMFGYLRRESDYAIVLGEFGGLYEQDLHPLRTTQRTVDASVDQMSNAVTTGYAGGYVWSLNPESAYEFNPASVLGVFNEGLLTIDWRNVNTKFLSALEKFDKMPGLSPLPCISS